MDRAPLRASSASSAAAELKEHKAEKRIRADLRVSAGGEVYYVDVTVAHATAKTYVDKRAAEVRLYAAGELAKNKRTKFFGRVHRMGAAFVPFACESYGAMSKDADDFMEHLADYYAKDVPSRRARFLRWIRSKVSVAIQHGNASVLHMAGVRNY
jgi:hypothetical protein